MAHWLVKSEPKTWSFADHLKKGVEPWTGVRNHQAAKALKSMSLNDCAFFYHSVDERAVVGVIEVVREAYIDPTDPEGRFVAVDFKALYPVRRPVTLADIKTNPKLEAMPLLRQSRLSVMAVSDAEWEEILRMAGGLAR